MSSEVLTQSLINWVTARKDEVAFNPKQGFYSYDIVVDAFEKGKEHGKELGKELGEQEFKERLWKTYVDNASKVSAAINDMLHLLMKQNNAPSKVFVSHSYNESIVLFSISEDIHHSMDFINSAYTYSSELKGRYLNDGIKLDIGFIDDNQHLNISLLRDDGFDFAYDLSKRQILE